MSSFANQIKNEKILSIAPMHKKLQEMGKHIEDKASLHEVEEIHDAELMRFESWNLLM